MLREASAVMPPMPSPNPNPNLTLTLTLTITLTLTLTLTDLASGARGERRHARGRRARAGQW